MNDILEKLKGDPYANLLGVIPEKVEKGYARCSLKVSEKHLNFGGFPHGGMLFSLADVAFSGAAASIHMPAIALNVTTDFCGSAKVGFELVAEAKLKSESRKFCFFDIEVKHGEKLVASFSGTAYKII